MIYFIDNANIDKISDFGQNFKFLCKLIGCETQEGRGELLIKFKIYSSYKNRNLIYTLVTAIEAQLVLIIYDFVFTSFKDNCS